MWEAIARIIEHGAGSGWDRTLQVLVLVLGILISLIVMVWIDRG